MNYLKWLTAAFITGFIIVAVSMSMIKTVEKTQARDKAELVRLQTEVHTNNNSTPPTTVANNIQPNVSMGGMSVQFPNPTNWNSKQVYIPGFGKTIYHYMMSMDDDGKGYIIAWVDYPFTQTTLLSLSDRDIQRVLEGGRDGAVSNVNGKLVWDREINISGIPGHEFSFVASEQGIKFIGHWEIFLKGNRLFQYGAIHPINIQMNDEKFFSSIQ